MTEQQELDALYELETAKNCIKIQKQTINHLNGLIDRQQKHIESIDLAKNSSLDLITKIYEKV